MPLRKGRRFFCGFDHVNHRWAPSLPGRKSSVQSRGKRTQWATFATMPLMAGGTPDYAAKQTSRSVEMFLTVYSK